MRRPVRSAGLRLAVISMAAAACLGSPPGGGGDPDAGDPDARAGESCPGNLVADGSFEQGITGWGGNNAEVTTVGDAHDGELAAQACSDGTAEADGYYAFDDIPPTVQNPVTGERYRLTLWVRAGPQLGPQNLEVVIREYDGEGQPHPSPTVFTPDDKWREVSASLTVESPAPDNVDAYVASLDPEVGNCFQVDAICLIRDEQ